MQKIDLDNVQGATSGTVREINRRILLNLVRKFQPVSRADLSRHSGLQRSTISKIADELIAAHWITESGIGYLPRGRPPRYLHLNNQRIGVIGVDLRPGRTTLALAGLDGRFLSRQSMPTPKDPASFVDILALQVQSMRASHSDRTVEAVGVAVPGRVDRNSHRLVFAPNLKWETCDLKGPLESATKLPVELENAANACALAELWSGRHGESVRNLVAVTVSEGLGVGMVFNGQLVTGASGLAGEFGHVRILDDGPMCACGNRGCWESCASNNAAVEYYTQLLNGRSTVSPGGVTFEDIMTLYNRGDRFACAALDRMAANLGVGLAMVITGLAPDLVVIVGEVTRVWNQFGTAVESVIRQRAPACCSTPLIPAESSTDARLRGTIALTLQRHFGNPLMA